MLTDIAGIRQQLRYNTRRSFRDHHDEIVLGTILARQLPVHSRNYRRIRTLGGAIVDLLFMHNPIDEGESSMDLCLLFFSGIDSM